MKVMADRRRTRQTPGQVLLGIVLLAGLLVVAYFLGRVAFRWFGGLDPQFSAALALAAATVIVVPITRWFERRRLREEPLQSRKVDVYERFIKGFLDNFFDERRGGIQQAKMAEFFFAITPDLTIWASDDVLSNWSRMRRSWASSDGTQPPPEVRLLDLEDLFLAVRRDLGHSNKGLKPGDVLGLWVNDLDAILVHNSTGPRSPASS